MLSIPLADLLMSILSAILMKNRTCYCMCLLFIIAKDFTCKKGKVSQLMHWNRTCATVDKA